MMKIQPKIHKKLSKVNRSRSKSNSYSLILRALSKLLSKVIKPLSLLRLGVDYMANFSPGSQRNPLEMKVAITWRFQPGLKILARFQKAG